MTECGILAEDSEWVGQERITAILIGSTRARYGCPGPHKGICFYDIGSNKLKMDPGVPLLKRREKDGQDHFYL